MKNKIIYQILLLNIIVFSALYSQCPPGGAIFVNEIYNDDGNNKEYIELVVVGDPANPTAPVNLEGWIVDDNNIDQSGQGTAPGHLKLNSTFNSVNPGAIILIYNENDPPAGMPANNPPWLYVVSGADLDGCSASPSFSNSSYTPCGTAGGDYDYVLMRNSGDIAQTRDPSTTYYHAVRYGGVNVTSDVTPLADVSDKSIGLDCGDWFEGSNYTITTQTPGDFNSPENENLIMAIRNGTLDCNDIAASCTPPCPIITDLEIISTPVCEDDDFILRATGLANMSQTLNGDKDFGIDFVYFNGSTPPGDAYSGGTLLDNVPYGSLTGTDPNQVAETTITGGTLTPGTYTICAILDDDSANDCKPQACEVVEILDAPEAQLGGTIEFCPGECHELNTQITGGESPYEANFTFTIGAISISFTIPSYEVNNQLNICYTGSLFPYYDSGTNTLYVPTYITGSGSIILNSLVSDEGNGCPASSINPDNTTLIFKEKLDINPAGPLEECGNSENKADFDLTSLDNTLTGGNNNYTVNWYEDMDCNNEINDPTSFYTDSTTVYVFLSDDTGEKCNSDTLGVELIVIVAPDAGEDNYIEVCNTDDCVDLFGNLGGSPEPGGTWSDDSGSGVDISDPYCVDFTGMNGGAYDFTYTTQDPTGMCTNSAVLTVDVLEQQDAGDDGSDTFCGPPDSPVDLEFYLGPDFDPGGYWTTNSNVDISDPQNVDMSGASPGTYVFVYHISGPPCVEDTATVTIEIFKEPNAGDDNTIIVCNSGNNTVADFNAALGTHDATGYWIDIDTAGVDLSDDSNVDFSGVEPGTYTFSYNIDAYGPCHDDQAVITVIVDALPPAGIDGAASICAGSPDTLFLFDYLGGEFDSTGIWIQTGGDTVEMRKNDTLILKDEPVGIDTFIYVTSGNCGNDTATVIVSITSSPSAGDDYSLTVCQYTTIDLFDSLKNYTPGGLWINQNGDTILIPSAVTLDEAQQYRFKYIIPASGTCTGDTATAIVTTIPPPEAGTGQDFYVCQNSNGTVNLFDYLTGYSSTAGTWYDENHNKITDPHFYLIDDNNIDTFTFTYILPDTTGYCDADTARLRAYIIAEPNAGTNNNAEVCNSDINNTLNLDSLLGPHDNAGFWIDMDYAGVDLNDPAHVSFKDIESRTFRFKYKIPANGTCPADSAVIVVYVLEKALAGDDKEVSYCEGGNGYVFLPLETGADTTAKYKFIDIDNSGALDTTKGTVSLSSLLPGEYHYLIITGENDFCGSDTAMVTVTITEAFNAGEDNEIDVCNSECAVNLDSLLGAHDPGGTWSDLDNAGVDITSSGGKKVSFERVEPGTYRFQYKIEASGSCPEASAIITVNVFPFSHTEINTAICPGDSITVGGKVFDQKRLSGVVVLQNIYGCDSIVSVHLQLKNINASTEAVDANCFGAGKFIIHDIQDATLPATVILNDSQSYEITALPFEITGLEAGEYTYVIIDSDGCTVEGDNSFSIKPFEAYSIEIEVTRSGDYYSLNVVTDIEANTVSWTPAHGLSCTDCLNPIARPQQNTVYTVTITDKEGCTVSDTVFLEGIKRKEIDIPNVFTPDGDGINDIFYAKSNIENATYSMYIFDRWGEKIFYAEGLKFNTSSNGWDGTFRGKKLNPGVFVYMIIIHYDEGKEETLSGDVLLLR